MGSPRVWGLDASLEAVAYSGGHLDDASEVAGLLEADLLALAHDPQADGDQIGTQLLRQVVVRAGQVLEEGAPQAAHEQRRLDGLARASSAALRRLQQRDRVADGLAFPLAGAAWRLVEHLCVGELVHGYPSLSGLVGLEVVEQRELADAGRDGVRR